MTYNVFGGTLNIAQLNSLCILLCISFKLATSESWTVFRIFQPFVNPFTSTMNISQATGFICFTSAVKHPLNFWSTYMP